MLTDMKRSKKDRNPETVPSFDGDDYGYGLRIELDDTALKKLGVKKLPSVGDEYIVAGVGVVENVNQSASTNSQHRSVAIQLQKIDIGPLKDDDAVDAVTDAIKDV